MLAVLLALAAGVLDRSQPLTFGHDFLPPYIAGRFVAEGRANRIYHGDEFEAVARTVIQDQNLTNDPSVARWINPIYFAAAFSPFSAFPYRVAVVVFLAINAGLAGAALMSLRAWLGSPRGATAFTVLFVSSCPFVLAMEHQQNTFVSLALLLGAVSLWRNGWPLLAGVAVGLLGYKPQIAALLALALWFSQGRRALAGLLLGGGFWLLLGEAVWPGSTLSFLRDVPPVVREIQSRGFNWGRQVTPTCFFRLLPGVSQSLAAGLGAATSLILIALLFRLARRLPPEQFIPLTIVAVPLAAPYFMDYDLLLLAVPAVLLARPTNSRITLALAAVLWLAIYINADLAKITQINVVVLLLMGWMIALWNPLRHRTLSVGYSGQSFALNEPRTQ